MEIQVCRQCGAELVPGTNFCRQCGAAVTAAGQQAGDEGTTAILEPPDSVATHRLDARPTSGNPRGINLPEQSIGARQPRKNRLLLIVIALIVAVGAAGIVALRLHKQSRIASDEGLIYPGAHRAMDITSDGGGRALSLETNDSFTAVDQWYRKVLNPEKVVQLTSGAVVLRNEKVTATIVREGDKTHILLKMVP